MGPIDGTVAGLLALAWRRTRIGCCAVGACLVALMLIADANAAVLCVTRSGTVKVRDACKRTETLADPVALGLQGPQGPPGPQGDPGMPNSTAPVWVDAYGNAIASFVPGVGWYAGNFYNAIRTEGDAVVRLIIQHDGPIGTSPFNYPVFPTIDCSGAAYIVGNPNISGLEPMGETVVRDSTLYYQVGMATQQEARSFLGNSGCQLWSETHMMAQAATTTIDWAQPLKLVVAVPAQ